MKKNAKGRSKTGPRFLMLPHFLLTSEAWRTLTTAERAVYLEIATLYNGTNNGRLGMGARRVAELCNISRNTAMASFRTLAEKGFIECVTPGGFSLKTRHQTEWRLTLDRCDVTNALPTKAFMRWRSNADHGRKIEPPQAQNRASRQDKAA